MPIEDVYKLPNGLSLHTSDLHVYDSNGNLVPYDENEITKLLLDRIPDKNDRKHILKQLVEKNKEARMNARIKAFKIEEDIGNDIQKTYGERMKLHKAREDSSEKLSSTRKTKPRNHRSIFSFSFRKKHKKCCAAKGGGTRKRPTKRKTKKHVA